MLPIFDSYCVAGKCRLNCRSHQTSSQVRLASAWHVGDVDCRGAAKDEGRSDLRHIWTCRFRVPLRDIGCDRCKT